MLFTIKIMKIIINDKKLINNKRTNDKFTHDISLGNVFGIFI